MSTAEMKSTVTSELLPGDLEAAERHFVEGTTFEPTLARRLHEYTERISEEIFQTRGLIDEKTMNELLRDDRDEE